MLLSTDANQKHATEELLQKKLSNPQSTYRKTSIRTSSFLLTTYSLSSNCCSPLQINHSLSYLIISSLESVDTKIYFKVEEDRWIFFKRLKRMLSRIKNGIHVYKLHHNIVRSVNAAWQSLSEKTCLKGWFSSPIWNMAENDGNLCLNMHLSHPKKNWIVFSTLFDAMFSRRKITWTRQNDL